MKILEFYKRYPDEESCKKEFVNLRLKEGVICNRCKGNTHYWKKKREQWECTNCAYRTTIKSGTVMQNSKLNISILVHCHAFIKLYKKEFFR
jgi:DNA-directed RNA polymerase subunit RPC12/RpoP